MVYAVKGTSKVRDRCQRLWARFVCVGLIVGEEVPDAGVQADEQLLLFPSSHAFRFSTGNVSQRSPSMTPMCPSAHKYPGRRFDVHDPDNMCWHKRQ